MDIFTIKQWLFILIVIAFGGWAYSVHWMKIAFNTLKKDNETLYKELKRITRDIPQ